MRAQVIQALPPGAGWPRTVRTQVGLSLLTGLAYYAASLAGLELRVPGSTPSVIWPPNALLTAILLQTPPRLWAFCILGVLPAHLAVQAGTGWPLPLVLGFFVTNCSEALIGATLARRWAAGPLRLDTLRGLALFGAAVVITGPLLSSFADAALVHAFLGESYWPVWRSRLTSNVLSELLVVPAVTAVLVAGPRTLSAPLGRIAEAAAIAACLAVTGVLAVTRETSIPLIHVVSAESPLSLPLPVLIWSAVRFGPHGAGVALSFTAVVCVYAAVNALGPFRSLAATAQVLPLQVTLTLVSSTLLVLSTLVAERRAAMLALTERVRIERFVARLASAFVYARPPGLQAMIEQWLPEIAKALDLQVCALLDRADDGAYTVSACWTATDVDASATRGALADPSWLHPRLKGRLISVGQGGEAGQTDTPEDRRMLSSLGLGSLAVKPMLSERAVLGAMVFGRRAGRALEPRERVSLRLVTDVLANVSARRRTEAALTASEADRSALLDSLPMSVAVVAADGRVELANRAWTDAAAAGDPLAPGCGQNLRDAYDALVRAGAPQFAGLAGAVDRAGRGEGGRITVDQLPGPDADRWSSISVVPLARHGGGAVVVTTDVSELRRVEMEAARRLDELGHVTRVASLGELTASLAHQLNQPLAAIVANTAAAQVLLDGMPDDRGELPAILDDIADGGRQASAIVQRVRNLLQKRSAVREAVDVGEVMAGAAALLRSEAHARRVTVSVCVPEEPLIVAGDAVLLQQVCLNLLTNALDAIAADAPQRVVLASVARCSDGAVVLAVEDSGSGLGANGDEIFEAFFTTKPHGLGLGLAIARSIVADHGGQLVAGRGGLGGARFEVRLKGPAFALTETLGARRRGTTARATLH